MPSEIKIYNMDCMEFLKRQEDNSIDLFVTSPPYNKNGFRGRKDQSRGKGRWSGADISYNTYDDWLDEKEYHKWQIDVLNEAYKKLKPTGSFFYNHKIRRHNHKASHPYEWILQTDFIFYQQIIWDRCGSCDHNVGYLDPITELIFWLTKDKPKVNKQNKYATEIWRFPPDIGNKHPAPFPEKLTDNIILLGSDENDIVCDIYLGSGTTAVSSYKLNRNFIGCEIDKEYFESAQKRIENHKKQLTFI